MHQLATSLYRPGDWRRLPAPSLSPARVGSGLLSSLLCAKNDITTPIIARGYSSCSEPSAKKARGCGLAAAVSELSRRALLCSLRCLSSHDDANHLAEPPTPKPRRCDKLTDQKTPSNRRPSSLRSVSFMERTTVDFFTSPATELLGEHLQFIV